MANKKDLRGGIVKMREVAQLLSGWADDMERSLEAEKKEVPKVEPEVAAAPAAEAVTEGAAEVVPAASVAPAAPAASVASAAAPLPAADAVRAELAAKCAAGFRAQVQALINSFGAAKFSEVAPEHYPALLEAVAGLGGDGHAG